MGNGAGASATCLKLRSLTLPRRLTFRPIPGLSSLIVYQRPDNCLRRVFVGLNVDGETALTGGLRRDRTDAGHARLRKLRSEVVGLQN